MFLYFLFSLLSGAPAIFKLAARDDPESCKSQLTRTLFGIVWSCLTTMILCAWTAVHPNLPPRGKWRAGWNRLQLMFWMIVAPELVLAWAVRQLFAAKDIRDAYNNSRQGRTNWIRWSLVQGHLVGMGGFTLIDPNLRWAASQDQNGQVLTNTQFEELINTPGFEFPDVTEADQRLGLTELELVTLALASLNAVTFKIWWHKPLGVQEPIRIYWKVEAPNSQDGERDNRNIRLSFDDVISKGWKKVKLKVSFITDVLRNPCKDGPVVGLIGLFIVLPIALYYIITFPFFVLFPLGITLLLRIIETEPTTKNPTQSRGLLAARIVASLQSFRYSLSSSVAGFVRKKLERIFVDVYSSSELFVVFIFGWFILLPLLFALLLLFLIFLIPFLTLLFLVSFIFTSVFDIVTTSTVRPGASHVPSFYAPITKSDRWSRMVVFATFGVIFGGIHCIGWYFNYPTNAERSLWRATSLSITVIPLIVAPIDFLLTVQLRNRHLSSCERFERIALLILDLIMTILLFIYVPVRLSLIAQALVLLRKQPPDALVAVDWTKYIPHLFSQ